ncbi:hypothetical protein [Chitinimonas lacunae]|uniref:DUF2938 domain-containing protein n=1 Tax=Chitinimonas lacunae TaxID=1963018 RepID=A0ABV8MN02_9NEIS
MTALKTNSWKNALGHALLSGGLASLCSTAVIALRSRTDAGSLFSGTNATSQWVWGEQALHRHGFSARHTLLGYAIHHACSIMWATIYERWLAANPAADPTAVLKRAEAVAAMAFTIDYTITPPRFRPGYEKHLKPASMTGVYGAFAFGLALATLWRRRMLPSR